MEKEIRASQEELDALLALAFERGAFERAKELLALGASPEAGIEISRRPSKSEPFVDAIKEGEWEKAAALAEGRLGEGRSGRDGAPPLARACDRMGAMVGKGGPEAKAALIKRLAELGADLGELDKEGRSPLWLAASGASLGATKAMLEAGARASAATLGEGASALFYILKSALGRERWESLAALAMERGARLSESERAELLREDRDAPRKESVKSVLSAFDERDALGKAAGSARAASAGRRRV